jgi:hypothetical protein
MYDEQPSGDCASSAKGVRKVAVGLANTLSQSPNVVTAIPIAGPFTAHTSGFFRLINESTNEAHLSNVSVSKYV